MKTIVNLMFSLLAIPFSFWLKAMVSVSLWGWFVVPLGVPAIGLAQALGLTLLGWFFTTGLDQSFEEAKAKINWEHWFTTQLVVFIVWGYGAVFHWMGV